MIEFDPALIEGARDAGPALEELIRAVWPEAYRVAYAVLRDRGLAEDCAQDACVSIARSLATLKDVRVFRSWMYRSVMNRAISIGRRERKRLGESLAEAPVNVADHATAIDLERAIGSLPLEQRAVIILHYYAGLSSAEIAGSTGLAASTVRFRLMLARRRLRAALDDTDCPAAASEGVSHA